MLSDLVRSLIRTYVPGVVAALVAWLVSLGVPVTDGMSAALVGLLGLAVGAVWYLAVRALEHRWPAVGALLGSPTPPSYDPPAVPPAMAAPPAPPAAG